MKIGFHVMTTEDTASVVDVAIAADERGFDTVVVGEHSHLPVATRHFFYRDGEMPDLYKRCWDPLISLAACATVTKNIKLMTGISLLAEHDPLLFAKQVGTLDFISGGRTIIGVGYGWNDPEMVNRGINPRRRRAIMREKIQAVKALWSQETAEYHGEHVDFTESWMYPKPVQRPHPPIHIGSPGTDFVFSQVAEWADGWFPVLAFTKEELPRQIARMREVVAATGRNPDEIEVSIDSLPFTDREVSWEMFMKHRPRAHTLERLRKAGVDRVLIGLPLWSIDMVRRALDEMVDLIAIGEALG